jgi:glyoxylase-like metal-dependent hydrolase (beta-lactamase superfamily II)
MAPAALAARGWNARPARYLESAMRTLVVAVAIVGLGISVGAVAEDTFGPVPGAAASQSFKLGKLRLVAMRGGQIVARNDGKVCGVDAGPAAVGALLKSNGLPDDRITLGVGALLVRTGDRVVLLDSGLGPKTHGNLVASPKLAGIAAETVTDVVITHSHGDHVGGLVDAGGGLAFPKATVIRMAAAEWARMKMQPAAADLVKTIEPRVKTFTPGTAIAPGVTPIALDGHSPGHVGYWIVSGKERLLDIGDLAHSSLVSLKKPERTMGFDGDAALAKATRKATLARLAKDQELVFAPHFPFPGVGHIAVDRDGNSWKPAAL